MSAFSRLPVVSWVDWESYPNLEQVLTTHHFHVLLLDGSRILSNETLFAQLAQDLPEEPVVSSHWDALNDALYNGFDSLETPCIAVVWLHADTLLSHDAEVMYIALDVFRQVAADLADEPSVEFRVFLIGAGTSFKPFSTLPPFRSKYR